MKHTMGDLYQKQSLPLSAKVKMTEERIKAWVDHWGEDGVYISFSGGKDSTVLLDIARRLYPDLQAVFVDTGLEYPEIRQFVKTFPNVEWLKPKKTFKQVVNEYGYPFISKEVSDRIEGAKKYIKELDKRNKMQDALTDRQTDRQTDICYSTHMADVLGIDRRENKQNKAYQDLKQGIFPSVDTTISNWWRYAVVTGQYTKADGQSDSMFNCKKYAFLLDAPFDVSAKCCSVMKKAPVHLYGRKTGRKPITAQTASESRLRTSQWLKNGCNGFDMKSPISNPMAFWTEQDVLLYIKINNLPICSVYGEVIPEGQIEGQMTIFDYDIADKGLFETDMPLLTTSGCKRTGCMFCGYGCHLEKGKGRFELMKESHPNQYEYIMKPTTEGGLNYKEVIDWINENGNLNIRY